MKKILVVDDDVHFAQILNDRLSGEGYQVVIASNGEDGLSKVASESPDLILLDLMMPKLDGMGFLKQLREDTSYSIAPVLILTQLLDMEKIAEATKLGIRGYIVKSEINLDAMVKTVKGCFEE